jgi:hypothetical protein
MDNDQLMQIKMPAPLGRRFFDYNYTCKATRCPLELPATRADGQTG